MRPLRPGIAGADREKQLSEVEGAVERIKKEKKGSQRNASAAKRGGPVVKDHHNTNGGCKTLTGK